MSDSVRLAKQFVALEKERQRIADEKSENDRARAEVKALLLDAFGADGIPSMRIDGMLVHLSRRISAKLRPGASKAMLVQAVSDFAPEIVNPAFSMSTLSKMLRDMMDEEGYATVGDVQDSLPPDMAELLQVGEWYDVLARRS